MNTVPIKFEYRGKQYNGIFSSVSGSGASLGDDWDLTINRFYFGQLHYSQYSDGWVFHSNSGLFEDLSNYFEAYLVGWFQ
jgi:hypothetical protein